MLRFRGVCRSGQRDSLLVSLAACRLRDVFDLPAALIEALREYRFRALLPCLLLRAWFQW